MLIELTPDQYTLILKKETSAPVASIEEQPLIPWAVVNRIPRQGISRVYDERCAKLSGEVTANGPESLELVLTGLVPDGYKVKFIDDGIGDVIRDDDKIFLKKADSEILLFGNFREKNDRHEMELNREASHQIGSLITAPRSSWGQRGLMYVNAKYNYHAPFDTNKDEQRFISTIGHIGNYFQKHPLVPGSLIAIGDNYGVGDVTGVNSMSLNYYHMHVADTGMLMGVNDILDIRKNAYWDNGISMEIGLKMFDQFNQILHNRFAKAQSQLDCMGITYVLPDLTPEQATDTDFMSFRRDVGLTIHEELRKMHAALYGTEYNRTVEMSEKAHQHGIDNDWRKEFESIFPEILPYNPSMGISKDAYKKIKYLESKNGLKRPFAWEFGLGFTEGKCIGTVTLATRNVKGIGAIEGLGFRLDRPSEWRSRTECEELDNYYRNAVDSAFSTVYG